MDVLLILIEYAPVSSPSHVTTRWFLHSLVVMTPSGVIATLGGWYLAETGRQPWVIHNVLRTADAVLPVPPSVLLSTLIAFVCIYALFITAFLIFAFHMNRRGPQRRRLSRWLPTRSSML
jgi:cytochrome d ubiquinol oxidase subunit I